VVLLTLTNFKSFAKIGGRLGEIQPLKILLAAHSFNLSGAIKIGPLAGRAINNPNSRGSPVVSVARC